MAYAQQTWANDPEGGTPVSAERLNNIESGIGAAASTADAAMPKAGGTFTGEARFGGEARSARAASADIAYAGYMTGETFDRWRMHVSGVLEIGPGTGARDTNLYRSAADTLKTDDSFEVGADLKHLGANVGFYGTAPIAKPSVTGSRADPEQALANLLNALQSLGLITNSTTI